MIVLFIWLLTGSIMDIRKRNVPAWFLVLGGIIAVVMVIDRQSTILDILKGMFPGMGLLILAFATKKVGYGDGISLVILGLVTGSGECLLVFAVSLFFSAIFSLGLLVFRKAGRNTRIPFLPFLAAGWLIIVMV